MRAPFTLIVLSFFPFLADAQQGDLDVTGTHPAGVGQVRFFDPGAFGQQKYEVLTYADVEGTPYLDDRWSSGTITLNDNKTVSIGQMRYNAYSAEIHYLDNSNKELAVDAQQVHRFTLMKPKDPAQLLGRFEAFTDMFSDDRRAFYRVLNDGKYRLVILDRCTIKKSNYDPLQGKKELHFITRTWYGIAEYEYVHPIFILDHDRIRKELELKPEQDSWLKERHNNLKSEADVIAFLDHLNKPTK